MNPDLNRRAVAEFLGSFALTFVGAGAVVTMVATGSTSLLIPAFAFGLTLAIAVSALGHISGAHFNPAITLGFLATRRITPEMAIVYWIAQFAGGIAAAVVLRVAYDDRVADAANLGAPGLFAGTNVGEGFLLEAVLTFLLALVVFATAVDPRGAFKYVGGFAIGLTVAIGILVAGPLTGGAFNPQRALGPELLSWTWSDAWIYFTAPPLGAVAAAVLYDRVFLRPHEEETGRA
ncbi:MAG: aquaporin [Thermoleophilia bacterium]